MDVEPRGVAEGIAVAVHDEVEELPLGDCDAAEARPAGPTREGLARPMASKGAAGQVAAVPIDEPLDAVTARIVDAGKRAADRHHPSQRATPPHDGVLARV